MKRKLLFAILTSTFAVLLCAQRLGILSEAPCGFDNETNGFTVQSDHDDDAAQFNEHETQAQGLGPLYNTDSCGSCHFNPVTGGISQVTELRAGHRSKHGSFVEAQGGSLIASNTLPGVPPPYVDDREDVRALRTSLNLLGDGFVEALADKTLIDLAKEQGERTQGRIRGQVVYAPVLEAGNILRVGRFGWKNQHASLISFSADAYLNEMGITTPFFPNERTSLGVDVSAFSQGMSPNNPGDDVLTFARFIRATKTPPRAASLAFTPEALEGERLFTAIGCAQCHVSTLVTAPPGTSVNGGNFVIPEALGNKAIHPYSDFLLHDVGTGDGIVQDGGPANKLRTPPLWGVRTRNRLMHDGLSLTFADAVERHDGEARDVVHEFHKLTPEQKAHLVTFLRSL